MTRQLVIFDLDKDIQTLKLRKFERLTGLGLTETRINTKLYMMMLNMIIGGCDVWILTSTHSREDEIRSLLKTCECIGEYADRRDIIKVITNNWGSDEQGEEYKIDVLRYIKDEDKARLTHVIRDIDEIVSIKQEDEYYNFTVKEVEDYRAKIHEEGDECDISL